MKMSEAITVRRMKFPWAQAMQAWWNPARPEFSQIVNSASLAMPFLEPYLIATMQKARPEITDAALAADVDGYIGQESSHFRQHQQFNRRLAALGYRCIPALEARLKDDYQRFAEQRSFRFNLAYAEGFEAMALTIGHMLVEERKALFGGADPAVSSLVLWHFVEEIEHKTVTYDVLAALGGNYLWRVWGLLFATVHVMARTRQGYKALLVEDGLWYRPSSRLAVYAVLLRIFRRLLPRLLRVLRPGYDPREVPDPEWATRWRQLHDGGEAGLGQLDTRQIDALSPKVMAA
jgi:predicted metal-dependent hydrolase